MRVATRFLRALRLDLPDKTLFLVNRVVELGESVAVFVSANEIFESLRKRGLVLLALGEGGIFYGVIVNESGLNELVFAERVEKRDKNVPLRRGLALLGLDAELLRALARLRVGFPLVVVRAAVFFYGFLDRKSTRLNSSHS